MCRHLLPLGALVFVLVLGCNQSPPSEKTSPEASHEEHDHEHDHAHEGQDHEHADHDHADHEHEHHEHGELAKTYDDAVEKIEAARDTIRDSLAAGETDKADKALHEMGHVLERIPDLAKSLPAESHEVVHKNVEELFDLFGKLDEQIHSQAETTYEEFSEKIDAAVKKLHEHSSHDHAEEEKQ